jgi:hypothetical protein
VAFYRLYLGNPTAAAEAATTILPQRRRSPRNAVMRASLWTLAMLWLWMA